MASNEYAFLTRWRVEAAPERVYRLIDDVLAYPRWWPEVWLGVTELESGDAGKVGSRYALHTRGWLPYTLRWESRTVEKVFPTRIALEAKGDFVGRGIWTFAADDSFTNVEYDWRLRADKPLLRNLSFAFKPLFRWNHDWAMARGLEGVRRELAAACRTT